MQLKQGATAVKMSSECSNTSGPRAKSIEPGTIHESCMVTCYPLIYNVYTCTCIMCIYKHHESLDLE